MVIFINKMLNAIILMRISLYGNLLHLIIEMFREFLNNFPNTL